jgi:signal transduction histidine kinase
MRTSGNDRTQWSTWAVDVALAAVILAVSLLVGPRGPALLFAPGSIRPLSGPPWQWAFLLVIAGPLVFRRRWPLAVLGVIAASSVVLSHEVAGPIGPVASIAVASFTVGERGRGARQSALVILALSLLLALGFTIRGAQPVGAFVLPFVVLLPAWLIGDVVRARREETARSVAAEFQRLRDSEAEARATVLAERRQLARELHDVVAHGVAVMLVQATAAQEVIASSPDEARKALENIAGAGREATAELRDLLNLLHDEGDAFPIGPTPGARQLETLVARVSNAGLPAQLQVEGTPRPLPPAADFTIYRVVQEALTNALRYAGKAPTTVRVIYDEREVRVEVVDAGHASGVDGHGTGRGLAGLLARVEAVGGRLDVGPQVGGGWAVRAWFPADALPA